MYVFVVQYGIRRGGEHKWEIDMSAEVSAKRRPVQQDAYTKAFKHALSAYQVGLEPGSVSSHALYLWPLSVLSAISVY